MYSRDLYGRHLKTRACLGKVEWSWKELNIEGKIRVFFPSETNLQQRTFRHYELYHTMITFDALEEKGF